MRVKVGSDFPVGIKLNSADFQRGGFSFEDSRTVAAWLDAASVDLIEISGGTYEQPAMTGASGEDSANGRAVSKASRARESYFASFGPQMRKQLKKATEEGVSRRYFDHHRGTSLAG